MIKQNESNEKNVFLLRVRAGHIADMKKLLASLVGVALSLLPLFAFAADPIKVFILDTGAAPSGITYKTQTHVFRGDNPIDTKGHGTMVAQSFLEGASQHGAQNVELHSIKITDEQGRTNDLYLTRAVNTALDSGAKIINISIGDAETTGEPTSEWLAVVSRAEAAGAVIVVAAGNEADKTYNSYAVNSPAVVSVGALDSFGHTATYTNGATDQSRVDVYEFGAKVAGEGTSFAAPRVAGAIAALMEKAPPAAADANGDGSWNSGEIKQQLSNGIAEDQYAFVAGGRLAAPTVKTDVAAGGNAQTAIVTTSKTNDPVTPAPSTSGLQCPPGQYAEIDYSVQFPTETCRPNTVPTGTPPPPPAVSCGQPGSNPATCIPSGSAAAPPPAGPSAAPAANTFCKQDGNNVTCTYVPLEPIPGVSQTGTNFSGFLSGLFRLLFTLGGMIAVASLVYGGVTYMVSEIVSNKEWAKKQIRASLVGLAILVAAWLILYTINPQLIQFNFAAMNVRIANTAPPQLFGSGNQLTTDQTKSLQNHFNSQVTFRSPSIFYAEAVDKNNAAAVKKFEDNCNSQSSKSNALNNPQALWNACKNGAVAGAGVGAAGWVAGLVGLGTTVTGAIIGCPTGAYTEYSMGKPYIEQAPGNAVGLPGQTIYSCNYYSF